MDRRAVLAAMGGLGLAGVGSCVGIRMATHESGSLSGMPTFGVVGGPKFPGYIDEAKEAGVRMVRHLGARLDWYAVRGRLPSIGDREVAGSWRACHDAGVEPLIQIYLSDCPAWAGTGLYHHGDPGVQSVRPEVVADFAAHVVEELPFATYFKLGNEMDRDGRAEWMDAYAEMMRAGYRAMKAARPDITVAIEGGRTYGRVRALLRRGVYDHADVIDHHLYGDAWLDRESNTHLPTKLRMMRDAGYDLPVIASEFGIPRGSGDPDYSPAQVAELFERRVAALLDMGVAAFCYFTFIDRPGTGSKVNTQFPEVFMIRPDGSRSAVYYSYQGVAT